LAGIAGFVSHADHTYRILAYTPLQKLPKLRGRLSTNDRKLLEADRQGALARQPNRLAVVRLPRRMTLAQFNQTSPSVIPLEELLVINQVASAETVRRWAFGETGRRPLTLRPIAMCAAEQTLATGRRSLIKLNQPFTGTNMNRFRLAVFCLAATSASAAATCRNPTLRRPSRRCRPPRWAVRRTATT